MLELSCEAPTVLTEGCTSFTGSPEFDSGPGDLTDVSSYFSSAPLGEFFNSALNQDSVASFCIRHLQTSFY